LNIRIPTVKERLDESFTTDPSAIDSIAFGRASNKPDMAKQFYIDKAIEKAAFILERIERRRPRAHSMGVPPIV
jgi:hypothetical protein